MSPEEWLASQKKEQPDAAAATATAPESPEQWLASRQAGSLSPIRGVKEAAKVLGGVAEVPLTMLSGAGASVLGGVLGAGRLAGDVLAGRTPDVGAAADLVQRTQTAGTYEPRTGFGRFATELMSAPAERLSTALGRAGEAVGGPAGRTIGEVLPDAAGTLLGARGMARARPRDVPLTQEQRALQRVQGTGYMAPPARANPSVLNQLMESMSGEYSDPKLTIKNQSLTNEKAKEALGLPRAAALDDTTFDTYRAAQGQAYDAIKQYPLPFAPDQPYLNIILNLDKQFRAMRENFPELARTGELDRLIASMSNPRSAAHPGQFDAAGVIDISRQLRSEAGQTFKKDTRGNATADEIALATAKRAAAEALESLLDRELNRAGSGTLGTRYREARQAIAMSHDVESATNPSTGNVDAQKLRALADQGRPLSGRLAEIVDAARTVPSVVRRTEGITPSAGLRTSDIGQAGILSKLARSGRYAALAGVRPVVSSVYASRPYQVLAGQVKQPREFGTIPMSEAAAGIAGAQPPEEARFLLSGDAMK
jgi:hypothetical protein